VRHAGSGAFQAAERDRLARWSVGRRTRFALTVVISKYRRAAILGFFGFISRHADEGSPRLKYTSPYVGRRCGYGHPGEWKGRGSSTFADMLFSTIRHHL
jgi:hypothetical protein